MAQTQSTTDETAQNDSEAIDVEIYQTRYVKDRDSEASQITRDVRCFGDLEDVTAENFEDVFRHSCTGEVSLEMVRNTEPVDDDAEIPDIAILEHIYKRCQGGHKDEQIGYDGTRMNSLSKGDVVVIDGEAHICASMGFDPVENFDGLRGEN